MVSQRPSAKIAVLCVLAALGLTALLATPAQAFESGEYRINGKTFEGSEAKLTMSSDSFWLFGFIPIYYCLQHTSTTITQNGKGEGTFEYSKCTVPEHEKTCKVAEPIKTKIVTQLIRHNGKLLERVEPATGTTLFTIQIVGEECPLSEKKVPVTGSYCGEFPAGESILQTVILGGKVDELCNQLIKTGLSYGEEPGELHGEVVEELFGKNKGVKWGGI